MLTKPRPARMVSACLPLALSGYVGHQIGHLFVAVQVVYPRFNRAVPSHVVDEPVKMCPDLRMGPGQSVATDQRHELLTGVHGM